MTGDPVLHTCTAAGGWTVQPPCPACQLSPPFTFTPIVAAWECTRCRRINAPHVSQCSCAPSITITTTQLPGPGEHG